MGLLLLNRKRLTWGKGSECKGVVGVMKMRFGGFGGEGSGDLKLMINQLSALAKSPEGY